MADENDPYFLFVLDVGEQDFHLLKRDQALLVEFPVFPSKMVELLQMCLESENSQSDESHDRESDEESEYDDRTIGSSTFQAKLDTSSGIFSIVETNMFKQLTHISLQMRQGNDSAIKSYLASRLALFMSKFTDATRALSDATQTLKSEVSDKANIKAALAEISSRKDVSEESMRSAHVNEIAQIQMSLMNQADAARSRYEGQLDVCRKEVDGLRAELKQAHIDAEEGTLELKRQKQHLEFRERELSRLLETAEGDRDRVFNECREISTAKRASDDNCSQLERQLARSGAQADALKLQLADRDEMVQSSKSLQHAAEDARKLLEEKLDMYIADADNLREKIKQGGMEITRGNAVIQRLQEDKKALTEKVKSKTEVIRKQETLVQELRSQCAELERNLLTSNDATKMAQSQFESTQGKLNEALDRLQESNKIVASNKEVISYLNEEINKWQLGLRTGTESMAIGSGLGVSGTVQQSKWASFDQNANDSSAQMFSPDTTRDPSYGGYHDQSNMSLNVTADKWHKPSTSPSAGGGDAYLQGLKNLGISDTYSGSGLEESGSGLEHLAYYADAETKADYDRVARASSQGATKYAWQAEDFGLDSESR